jgi:hypothetical protein
MPPDKGQGVFEGDITVPAGELTVCFKNQSKILTLTGFLLIIYV